MISAKATREHAAWAAARNAMTYMDERSEAQERADDAEWDAHWAQVDADREAEEETRITCCDVSWTVAEFSEHNTRHA